ADKTRRVRSRSSLPPGPLATADVRPAFRVACMRRGLPFIPGEKLTRTRSARELSVPGRASSMFSDDTFAIGRPGKEPALFFIEADCDSEQNKPKVQRTVEGEGDDFDAFDVREAESIGRKFDGYFSYARAE